MSCAGEAPSSKPRRPRWPIPDREIVISRPFLALVLIQNGIAIPSPKLRIGVCSDGAYLIRRMATPVVAVTRIRSCCLSSIAQDGYLCRHVCRGKPCSGSSPTTRTRFQGSDQSPATINWIRGTKTPIGLDRQAPSPRLRICRRRGPPCRHGLDDGTPPISESERDLPDGKPLLISLRTVSSVYRESSWTVRRYHPPIWRFSSTESLRLMATVNPGSSHSSENATVFAVSDNAIFDFSTSIASGQARALLFQHPQQAVKQPRLFRLPPGRVSDIRQDTLLVHPVDVRPCRKVVKIGRWRVEGLPRFMALPSCQPCRLD